ncbi:hypothetical protein [Roseateles toxinivorans]|uniref:Uncharacterized protein n=1 Tax=Roseateles toxinivorans TaxID=270368 RepID=A0A4R6QH14_9BURK|nr:hypothetical protein [Roseateles toxinivorans]TDP61369.1 hypothetical protein DES47_11352 [Roseateles toxinivorans]
MSTAIPTMPALDPTTRAIAEPYTFALVQWPALLGLLALDGAEGALLGLRVLLGLWLALMVLASYGQGRGFGFGNAMTLAGACVAGAWWSQATPWVFGWLAAVLMLLLTAQRLRLRASR